jgi:hypothetical protein
LLHLEFYLSNRNDLIVIYGYVNYGNILELTSFFVEADRHGEAQDMDGTWNKSEDKKYAHRPIKGNSETVQYRTLTEVFFILAPLLLLLLLLLLTHRIGFKFSILVSLHFVSSGAPQSTQ